MTTATTTSTPVPDTAHAPIPLSRLFRVEFRKSWDTGSAFWLLFSIVVLVFGAEIIALAVTASKHNHMAFGDFAQVAGFLSSVLLPVLGIMLVTSEWSQRSAMVTFALEPRRGRIIWTKLAVGIALALIMIVLALGLGAICEAIYGLTPGNSADWNGASDLSQGIAAFTIVQVLNMVSGFALAAIFLSTPTAIVFFFLYSFLLPTIIAIGSQLMNWFDKAAPWFDINQAKQTILDWDMSGKDWAHVITSILIWVVLPFVLGLWRIFRAEVK